LVVTACTEPQSVPALISRNEWARRARVACAALPSSV
jgi:hypothetical protein